MPRNRMIKADFWSDEKVGGLSHTARLLFIGTWNFADDGGACRANPIYLRNNIFPYDDITIDDIKGGLNELSVSGLVELYECTGESYLLIPKFLNHQTINRPSDFRYPRLSEHSVSSHPQKKKEKESKRESKSKSAFSDLVEKYDLGNKEPF